MEKEGPDTLINPNMPLIPLDVKLVSTRTHPARNIAVEYSLDRALMSQW